MQPRHLNNALPRPSLTQPLEATMYGLIFENFSGYIKV